MPMTKKINKMRQAGKGRKIVSNKVLASGIKSVMETQIITPAAKDKAPAIKVFFCFVLKKIGMVPNKVDSPAKNDNKKALEILLIVSSPLYFIDDW